MIGTDEMSSTGMDISESFRPEDISKTDFFDFVTAPDMGIGLGVNVNLHHSHHHHQQHQHHHHHTQHHTQQQPQAQASLTMTQQQQQHHQNNNNNNTQAHHGSQHQPHQQHSTGSDRTMTHDGGGGGSGSTVSVGTTGDSHNDASGLSDGSSASTTDPALHGYEFWTSGKEHTSTIFEDLDRYCWQQQTNTTASPNNSSVMHHSSPANTLNPLHTSTINPSSPHNHHSPATPVNTSTSLSSTPVPQNQLNSDGNISNIISTDGQIYTLTVLNGNEPWLKRDADAHLNSTLDLDSLLGTFPGYIKSEYPYDDSGFSTDGCKDVTNDTTNVMNNSSSSGVGGSVLGNNQRLPSLINTISVTSSGAGGGGNVSNVTDSVTTALSIGQQLDQFHNNNNDWHMTDHNNEQNSAESLLRSALQGKGYAKGLHIHNGMTLMPTSPTVKDDDMRRILFPVDTDGLNFSDTSLSAAQIFDDTQSANSHNTHIGLPHSPVTNGPLTPVTNNPTTNNNNNSSNQAATSLIVDDMFLTLENAFSDDFEKIKQQFCSAGSNANDYAANDVMMQLSPSGNGSTQGTNANTGSVQAVTTSHQTMLTNLHTSAITTTTMPNNICRQTTPVGGISTTIANQQQQHPPPQPLKPEVTTSTQRIMTTAKTTKKYKRTLSAAHHNTNNNNPNVINHNNSNNATNTGKGSTNNMTVINGQNRNGNNSSSGSSTNSSNSPTHCNGLVVGSGAVIGGGTTTTSCSNATSNNSSSSSSTTSTSTAQRKERSLHYCSICSKGFKDKYSVNVHIRTHTGEKPFACTLCGKSFRQKAHLAKHYQTHMAQKNNGSLVKGSSSKHHRSSSTQNLNTPSMAVAHNHSRSLSIASTPNTASALSGNTVGGLVSGILTSSGLPSLGIPVTASSAPTTPTAILPPANGLLANR